MEAVPLCSRYVVLYPVIYQNHEFTQAENVDEILVLISMPQNHAHPEEAEVKVISTGYKKLHVMVLNMAAYGQGWVPKFLSSSCEESLDLTLTVILNKKGPLLQEGCFVSQLKTRFRLLLMD